MAIPVILDCDPGVDDAAGILLAFARPELDVRAITTVGGNTSVAHTTRNTLDCLPSRASMAFPSRKGRIAPCCAPSISARTFTARPASVV